MITEGKLKSMKTTLGKMPDGYEPKCLDDYHIGFGQGYNEAIDDVLILLKEKKCKV